MIDKEAEEFMQRPDSIFIDELNTASIRTMLQEMEKPGIYAGVFLHSDGSQTIAAFT